MMREILFRGKEKVLQKWYEGSYYQYTVTTYCCAEDYALHPENTRHYILFDMITDWGLPNQHYRVEIIPETLGQYTGLKDKNGKRIFEGDIVRGNHFWHEKQKIYQVAFDDGDFYLVNDSGTACRHEHVEDIEIIGNIHDNPELLEVSK